jgi:hypothetical protein
MQHHQGNPICHNTSNVICSLFNDTFSVTNDELGGTWSKAVMT